MNRALCLALLAAAACSDSSKPAPPTAVVTTPPIPGVVPGASRSVAPRPPAPVALDDAMVGKYVAATRSVAQELKVWGGAKDEQQRPLEIPAAARRRIAEDAAPLLAGKLGELSAAAIAKEGLPFPQYQRITALCDNLLAERKLFDDWGGEEGLAAMEADVKAQLKQRLARLPANERPRAEASAQADLKKLSDVRALGAATETRRKFGDADVDLLLKHIRDIRAVRTELSEALPPIFR